MHARNFLDIRFLVMIKEIVAPLLFFRFHLVLQEGRDFGDEYLAELDHIG